MDPQTSQQPVELKLIREISGSLQKLLGLHRQLWDQVRAERDALINADRHLIQEVALAKKALVESIRAIETGRLNSAGLLARAWKKEVHELSLSFIILRTQELDSQLSASLQTQQNALRHLAERIQVTNDSNRQLVENSMKHVDQMKRNLMGEVDPKSTLYTPQGGKGSPSQQSGQARFLSKEA